MDTLHESAFDSMRAWDRRARPGSALALMRRLAWFARPGAVGRRASDAESAQERTVA